MAWKQDLAKLKQQLGPETEASAPKPRPKPVPRPEGPLPLEDEDAVFLSAMGLKRPISSTPRPAGSPEAPTSLPEVPTPAPETFEEALRDLKGLKPLVHAPAAATPRPAPVRPVAESSVATPAPPPAPIPVQAPTPLPSPEPASAGPVRFQLAAGMAIEVDGTLDLRGHALSDAVERLKDRLGDGAVLGWRSLQVILGPDPLLHEGLLELLASGQTPMVLRYAQAPVPMGGTQAWLLYLGPNPAQS